MFTPRGDFSPELEKIERLKLQRLTEQEESALETQRHEQRLASARRQKQLHKEESDRLRQEAEKAKLERLAEEERIMLNQLREEEQRKIRETKRRQAELEVRRIQRELDEIEGRSSQTRDVKRIVQFTYQNPEPEDQSFVDLEDQTLEADLLGMDEQEVENQCDQIFLETVIPFVRRKGNDMDMAIADLLGKLEVTIPVLHIKDNLYLIGSQRLNL